MWVCFVINGRPSDVDPEKPNEGIPALAEKGNEPDETMVRKIEKTIRNDAEVQ